MNDNQNWRNVGEQMKNALSDALRTGDFKKLNNLVSQTVANTLNEVGIHIMPEGNEQHNNQNVSTNFSDKDKTQAGQPPPNSKQAQGRYGQASDTQEQAFHRWGYTNEKDKNASNNWQKAPDSQGQAFYNGQRSTNPKGHFYNERQTAGPHGQFYNRQRSFGSKSQAFNNGQQTAGSKGQDFYNGNQTTSPHGQFYNRQQASNLHGQAFYKHQNMGIKRQMPAKNIPNMPLVPIKKVGSVSGTLYQIFGGIGFGITSIIALILMSVYLVSGNLFTTGSLITLIFLSFFFGMIRIGISRKRRLGRARRYIQLCDNKMFEDIKKLARGTGADERYVIKDIQRMLKVGIFPEGHLDSQKTCFMLNDKVYRQYLDTEENHRQREEEKQKLLNQNETIYAEENQTSSDTLTPQETELNTMVSEGMECIRKLRDLNDKISGEVISEKLFNLENLLKNIFERVKEHPEQMSRMHKLMSYYLPTTLKLIEAYEEFDQISSPGREITDAKAEIENTLDTINQAFSELLNNLFQDAVFDATTDAQVLKTMLAQEGLMNELEFAANKTEKTEN